MSIGTEIRKILVSVFNNTIISGVTIAETVSVQKITQTDSNENIGAPIFVNPAAVTPKAIIKEYTKNEIIASNGRLETGDRKFVFNAVDIAINGINLGDEITFDSVIYRIESPVVTKRFDGQKIIIIAQGRPR